MEEGNEGETNVSAEGSHFALSEVDEAGGFMDHDQGEGDEGIDTAV